MGAIVEVIHQRRSFTEDRWQDPAGDLQQKAVRKSAPEPAVPTAEQKTMTGLLDRRKID